jgi:BirA family biotin operon repressor/biotin-[acetyl-CoA-carboxylase] ligase
MDAQGQLATWAGRSIETLRAEWDVPRILAFAETASTNDLARELAESGAPELTTVLADAQTAGRGRFGRTWTAPPESSLLISFVLRPRAGPGAAPSAIPLRVGMAVARAIERVTHVFPRLKWPNDILAGDDRKLAGVLCEAATSGRNAFIVAGIGINVNQSLEEWPEHLRPTAASLLQVVGRTVDRAQIAGALVDEIRGELARIDQPLDVFERASWDSRDALRDRAVHVDGEAAGFGAGVTPHGALRLRTSRGARVLWSGTVRLAALAPRSGKEVAP